MNSAELCFLCSLTGNFKGMCKQIDHFPEETDYEADPSEYFLREYMSSLFSHRGIQGVCAIRLIVFCCSVCFGQNDRKEKTHQAFLPMFS